jgi:hypothetical protein
MRGQVFFQRKLGFTPPIPNSLEPLEPLAGFKNILIARQESE